MAALSVYSKPRLVGCLNSLSIIGIVVPRMRRFSRALFSTVNAFNAHTVLGLHKLASEKEIKRAYYSLAKMYHPDSNPGQDTSAQFQRVTHAYQLMTAQAAARAHRNAHSEPKTNDGDSNQEDRMFRAYQTFKRKHGVKTDSFQQFMNFYKEYNEQKRAAHPPGTQEQQEHDEQEEQEEEESEETEEEARPNKHRNKKLNITVEVQLSAEEAKVGTDQRLKVWKKVSCTVCHGSPPHREAKCKKCHGSGVHISKNEIGLCWTCGGNRTVSRPDCHGCAGKGQFTKHAEEVLHVKPGVTNNEEIILRGKGHQHPKKGFFGDILVRIRIEGYEEAAQEDGIKKVGFNTYETVKITVLEAVLGTKLKYRTVWGEKTVPLRGGVQDGHVIKRSGEGCRKKSHKDNGHHFITIAITIPLQLSPEESQIYERIREIYQKHRQRSY